MLNEKKRFSYVEGIGNQKYKDRDINKLFIIGLAENVAESCLNLEKILKIQTRFEALRFEDLRFKHQI